MKTILLLSTTLFFVACGESNSGTGGSTTSTKIIPMPNAKCGNTSCVPSSFIGAKSASSDLNWAGEYVNEIETDIIKEISSITNHVEKVLGLLNITSCEGVPLSGTQSATYLSQNISLSFSAPTTTTLYGTGVSLSKKIEASVGGSTFFKAEFNCTDISAAKILANFNTFNNSLTDSYHLYFLINGDQKNISIYNKYKSTDGTKTEAYMANVKITSTTDFEAHFAWDGDTSIVTDTEEMLAVKQVGNKQRVEISSLAGTNPSADFAQDTGSGSAGIDREFCYSSYIAEANCGGFSAISTLNNGSNIEGMNATTSSGGTAEFSLTKMRSLIFSL